MALPDRQPYITHENDGSSPEFQAVPGLAGFTPDPHLEQSDQISERIILYHLIQSGAEGSQELAVGPDLQSEMRRELGLGLAEVRIPLASLTGRGVLRAIKHGTALIPEQLLRSRNKPFFTPRVLNLMLNLGIRPDLTVGLTEATLREDKLNQRMQELAPAKTRPFTRTGRLKSARPSDSPQLSVSEADAEETPKLIDPREEQRNEYIDSLYRALGKNINMLLPDHVVDRALRRLTWWRYSIEGVHPTVRYLTRHTMGVLVELPTFSSPNRSVNNNEDTVTIRIDDDHTRARDLRALLAIEAQLPFYAVRQVSPKGETEGQFRETRGIYLEEGDVLTDTETVALSRLTHNGSLAGLARDLGISNADLGRILKPLKQKLGIESSKGSPDSYVDLTLTALSLKTASLDHLPPASKREREVFTSEDMKLMSSYYSPDPDERATYRSSTSPANMSNRWSQLYKRIGLRGDSRQSSRHSAALYAVRHEYLQLPDAAEIRKLIAS